MTGGSERCCHPASIHEARYGSLKQYDDIKMKSRVRYVYISTVVSGVSQRAELTSASPSLSEVNGAYGMHVYRM